MYVWKISVTIRVNKMAATMEDFKKHKSKYQVAKSNCTKAIKKLDAAFVDFSKNNGPDMSPMWKMRFAALLIEAEDFSKSKTKELEKIVTNFVELITDLEKSNFNDPSWYCWKLYFVSMKKFSHKKIYVFVRCQQNLKRQKTLARHSISNSHPTSWF